VAAEAEPVLLDAARRLDPPRLRKVLGHLRLVADPNTERDQAERRHGRRGLWLSPTWEGMVALDGLLEPEAGQLLLAALEPLARPADADDNRTGGQRQADALTELARQALESGRLPKTGGVRPHLLVTVDLDSLLGGHGCLGGDAGGVGPLDPEACRRLACDGAVTRVVVSRQPGQGEDPAADLTARLQAAMTLLPPILGGAPSQPLDVGRTHRVIQPAQRNALVVRDGGCVVPGCDRPPPWCEGHQRFGSPDVLELQDIAQPAPRRRRRAGARPCVVGEPGRVVRGDGPTLHRTADDGLRGPRHTVPGADFAGSVEAVGSAVTDIRRRGVRRHQQRSLRRNCVRPPDRGHQARQPDLRAGGGRSGPGRDPRPCRRAKTNPWTGPPGHVAEFSRGDSLVLQELLDAGKVTPVIDRRDELSEVPAALSYLGEGHARAKVVITV
jgi:hypothetical protein